VTLGSEAAEVTPCGVAALSLPRALVRRHTDTAWTVPEHERSSTALCARDTGRGRQEAVKGNTMNSLPVTHDDQADSGPSMLCSTRATASTPKRRGRGAKTAANEVTNPKGHRMNTPFASILLCAGLLGV
jgi:hypothetical protein